MSRPSTAQSSRPGTAYSAAGGGGRLGTPSEESSVLRGFSTYGRKMSDFCKLLDKSNTGVIRFQEFVSIMGRYGITCSAETLHALFSATCRSHSRELAEYREFLERFGVVDIPSPSQTSLNLKERGLAKPRGVRKTFDDLSGVSWNNEYKQTIDSSSPHHEPLINKLLRGEYYENQQQAQPTRPRRQLLDKNGTPVVQTLLQGNYYGKEEGSAMSSVLEGSMRRKKNDFVARNKMIAKRFSDYVAEQRRIEKEEEERNVQRQARPASRMSESIRRAVANGRASSALPEERVADFLMRNSREMRASSRLSQSRMSATRGGGGGGGGGGGDRLLASHASLDYPPRPISALDLLHRAQEEL